MEPDQLDEHTPEEIATGTTEFIMYLEECDSQECNYTWEALIRGSVLLYDFRKAT
jgi:hypothetical protein